VTFAPSARSGDHGTTAGVSSGNRSKPGRLAPWWVWIAWSGVVAALLLGLALWIVHGVVGGVPGPVVAGVYVSGAIDVAVAVIYIMAAAALATVAAVMIGRVPENRIGWILGAVAVWMAATFLLIMTLYFLNSPGDSRTAFANWLGTWTFVPAVPTSLVLMIFPDGLLLSPRWRILPWLAVAGTVGWAVTEATGLSLGLNQELPNRYANPDLLRVGSIVALALLPALFGTVASLVVRFRRAFPEVRMQIKWVALGGALQVVVILVAWAADMSGGGDFPVEAVLVGMLSTLFVPIALGLAILRFRLYDIDRLVSRTVSYAVLGSLLAAVFFAGVLGTQAVFGASSDWAVAGTTLAVAALFDPLRRRLHGLMDRKFNRQRFDFERVVDAFSTRVSAVTDTDDLATDLSATLADTLAPASIGLWIRR
jgi:hypothetical protein